MQSTELDQNWIKTAIEAAKSASDIIMEIYNSDFEVFFKADRSPVTTADKKASKIIVAELSKTNIPIISEEEINQPFEERKGNALTWIVDPIDGTKEFVAKNGEFCICIALIKKNSPVFGLIASPVEEKILIGGKSIGAYYFPLNESDFLNQEYRVSNLTLSAEKTVAYSRSHFSTRAQQFMDGLRAVYGDLNYIKKGSALKFVDLVLGRADFYPRFAPTMEWDIAAGQAIYEAVGGEVLDFTNFEPLKYNKENLYNPFFIAKNKELTI